MLNFFECPLCQNKSCPAHEWICKSCSSQFIASIQPRIAVEDSTLPFPVFAALKHTPTVSKFVRLLKTQPEFKGGVEPFIWVQNLCHHWLEEMKALRIDCVVAIPSNPLRTLKERPLSFHLGLEWSLALEVSSWDLEAIKVPLTRVLQLSGAPQKSLKRKERLGAPSDSHFKMSPQHDFCLGKRRVLLVDDVMTTGASLKNAEALLKKQGAKVLGAFVLSRVEATHKTH
jgi:predicted amidophosphoribosyltransferase